MRLLAQQRDVGQLAPTGRQRACADENKLNLGKLLGGFDKETHVERVSIDPAHEPHARASKIDDVDRLLPSSPTGVLEALEIDSMIDPAGLSTLRRLALEEKVPTEDREISIGFETIVKRLDAARLHAGVALITIGSLIDEPRPVNRINHAGRGRTGNPN